MERPTNPWPRIDAWLAKNAPNVLEKLRPPAPAAALAKLEKILGRPLPVGVADAYRAHDGAAGENSTIFGAVRVPKRHEWARLMWWLPLEEAYARLKFMEDLGEWPEGQFPIAEDAGGNLLLVDLASGIVGAWDHENWNTKELAKDFGELMTNLAADMEAMLVVTAEEEEEDDALELLDKPAVPAEQDVAPDRAARELIEVMIERRVLALRERFDVEPLIAELAEALESGERRKAKVIDVLEESEVVDEVFADDETIEILLDEVL
jgi:cell wall assembly regulator SMI1